MSGHFFWAMLALALLIILVEGMKRSRRKRKKGPGSLDDLIFLLKSNPKTYPSP